MKSQRNGELITEVTKAFFDKAEKVGLDPGVLRTALRFVHRICSKDPKAKGKRCTICGKG